MSKIHKSAIVSKTAIIGKNVTIGPYSIIDENVKIADNNIIHSHVLISGNTDIDESNEFFSFSKLPESAFRFFSFLKCLHHDSNKSGDNPCAWASRSNS